MPVINALLLIVTRVVLDIGRLLRWLFAIEAISLSESSVIAVGDNHSRANARPALQG